MNSVSVALNRRLCPRFKYPSDSYYISCDMRFFLEWILSCKLWKDFDYKKQNDPFLFHWPITTSLWDGQPNPIQSWHSEATRGPMLYPVLDLSRQEVSLEYGNMCSLIQCCIPAFSMGLLRSDPAIYLMQNRAPSETTEGPGWGLGCSGGLL